MQRARLRPRNGGEVSVVPVLDKRDTASMRRLWLGDALDFWKGSFLHVLRSSSPSPMGLQVVPMFTDSGWTSGELDTYARFLGVSRTALLLTTQFTNPGRASYFTACRGQVTGDTFVDPDNGVAPGRPQPAHIAPAEIAALLTDSNVVAVYQHRPQRVATPWLGRYTSLVSGTGVTTMGYESAQVGMIFATKSKERETTLRRALANHLGAVASPRVDFPSRLT